MSLPWKSELRIDLRQRSCRAAIASGPWPLRARRSARADGAAPMSLTHSIEALQRGLSQSGASTLPRRARLTIPDERVFYSLLPAEGSWREQRSRAQAHFAGALGRQGLSIQATLLPGGRRWLVAAVEATDLQAWRQALQGAGVTLSHVHPALVEDLRHVANSPTHPSSLIVLLRDEGAMFVRLDQGSPCALSWERFDPGHPGALARRTHAFALGAPGADDDAPVVLVPANDDQYNQLIDAMPDPRWQLREPIDRTCSRDMAA